MFGRSRRNLAHWFTLSMGSILLVNAQRTQRIFDGNGDRRACNPGRSQFKGNPDLLTQAIVNLLTNACKYTLPEGTVWVRLVSQYHRLLIQVEDTGIGIPVTDLPHIFERFYRVDAERGRDKGGTVLGLSIAYQIIAAHGGHLTVSSQVGKGSLFQIEFPVI